MKFLRWLGRAFAGSWRWLVRVILRRRPPAASPAPLHYEPLPPTHGPDQVGQSTPDPFDDLFPRPRLEIGDLQPVGEPDAPVELGERRLAALRQQGELREGTAQSWRSSRHGHVVALTDEREALLLSTTDRRPGSERSLRTLIALGPALRSTPPPVGVELRWPTEALVGFDGGVDGYVSETLNSAFVEYLSGSRPVIRTLGLAGSLSTLNSDAGSVRRRNLAMLVGDFVQALHRHNVVFGAVDLDSIAVNSDGTRISPIDYVGARVLGSGNWCSGVTSASTLDADRLGFAGVVFRLLAPNALGSSTEYLNIPMPSDLPPRTGDRLRWLFARAAGARGSMPTIEEWLTVLSEAGRESDPSQISV